MPEVRTLNLKMTSSIVHTKTEMKAKEKVCQMENKRWQKGKGGGRGGGERERRGREGERGGRGGCCVLQ